jgi:Flp pilus assembly protein TadB
VKTEPQRIGDAERDAAIAALSRHYGDGRLTSQEHEERVELAMNARTDADLGTLFADLPRFDDAAARRHPGVQFRSYRLLRLMPIAIIAIVVTSIVLHALPFILLVPLAFLVTRFAFGRGGQRGCGFGRRFDTAGRQP